jgi:hypothetical protein
VDLHATGRSGVGKAKMVLGFTQPTLEVNAALRSIVRRDSGETDQAEPAGPRCRVFVISVVVCTALRDTA